MKRIILFSAVSILLLLAMCLNCFASCLPLTKKELILKSHYVFHGTVTEVRSAWTEDQTMIYTYVTLEVHDVFKGELPNVIVIRLRGGLLDGKGIMVTNQPELEEAMEVIIHARLLDNGHIVVKGCEQGANYVNDGVIRNSIGKLIMPLDQFGKFVDEVISQEESQDDE